MQVKVESEKEWNKLDSEIRNAETCFLSKNASKSHKTHRK